MQAYNLLKNQYQRDLIIKVLGNRCFQFFKTNYLKDDRFIKLIDNEEFPVTIGAIAFFTKYLNNKFNKK